MSDLCYIFIMHYRGKHLKRLSPAYLVPRSFKHPGMSDWDIVGYFLCIAEGNTNQAVGKRVPAGRLYVKGYFIFYDRDDSLQFRQRENCFMHAVRYPG